MSVEIVDFGYPEEDRRGDDRRVIDLFESASIPAQGLWQDRRIAERRSQGGAVLSASDVVMPEAVPQTETKGIHDLESTIFTNSSLGAEVMEAQAAGYDIEIVATTDPAYEKPEKVYEVFTNLHTLGLEYSRMRSEAASPEVGRNVLGINIGQNKKQTEKQRERQREQAREALLYGPVQGEAWHDQRGSATALLSIQAAHDLETGEGDGIYPTMSAMLDETVLDHRFDEGNSLTGQTLREAMISTGGRFYGKNEEQSARYADKKLAELDRFIHTPSSPDFADIVRYCSDSLGIRSRKEIVRQQIDQHVTGLLEEDPERKEMLLLSVGCGTALPIFEVALDARKNGVEAKLLLLDQDPIALASAVTLARKMGLEDNIEVHCERLFSKFGKPIDMQKLLRGRQLDVVEDSGLREYLPDRIYKALAKESWDALRPGGLMTSGNMNVNRPQPEFLHNLMGWLPKVQMRTINECIALHEKAGIPAEHMQLKVTQEGVYTVYVSRKPVVTGIRT